MNEDRTQAVPFIGRAAAALVLSYICLSVVFWSPLPWNMQWCDVLFAALLVLAILARPPFRLSFLDVLVIAYLCSAVPSLATSTVPGSSVIGLTKQAYLAVVYGLVAVLVAQFLTPSQVARWLAAVAATVAGVGLLAVAIFFLTGVAIPRLGVVMPLPYVGRVYRLYCTFPSPEYLVNFLAFATPLVVIQAHGATTARERMLWMGAVAAVLGASCFSIAHGAAGAALAFALIVPRVWQRRRRLLAVTLLASSIVLVAAVNVLLVFAVRDVEMTTSRNLSVEQRPYPYAVDDGRPGVPSVRIEVAYNVMSYWFLKQLAFEAWQREPWTGVGLAAFHGETGRAVEQGRMSSDYRATDPHSTWLGRLAETGLVGTAGLAALWVGFLGYARHVARGRTSRDDVLAAFTAGLVGVLANSVNVDAMNFRFVWLAFAVLRSTK
ncbi:MAG: O-antigen ligase family protein [Acidobacteriota bacterium]